MMLALSGGAHTPDFWRWACDGGCGGCGGGWHRCGCGLFGWRCGCCGWRAHHLARCGCCGSSGGYGGYGGYDNVMPSTVRPMPSKTFMPSELSQNDDTPNVFATYQPREASRPAMVLVKLPADARLTFNGWTSASKTTTRRFRTPALEPGQEFAYTIHAELFRDGQTLVQDHQVVVRAGQETRVNIQFPTVVVSRNQQ
jgi:uncharacterized protein (TIGR03000 family)